MSGKRTEIFLRRQRRVRLKLRSNSGGRLRLSVFRSSKHIYAQVIDDAQGLTLASASTKDPEIGAGLKTGANIEAAKAVGALVARRALEGGITEVVFDRGGYLFHGRVKALAEAAREAGLEF